MALNDDPRFERTPHLVALIADTERLAGLLRTTTPGPTVVQRRLEQAALASLHLDGSTIPGVPTDDDLALAEHDGHEVPASARGSWADALRSQQDLDLQHTNIWAREFTGVLLALGAGPDQQAVVHGDLLGTLRLLHAKLVRHLAPDEEIGRLRTTPQAVHDTSIGRVIYYATPPGEVPANLHVLADWLAGPGSREHALVQAGIVHAELLRIHPFESANGRSARAAARVLLGAGGLDPHLVGGVEVEMARDAVGTYEEVARTMRRRDLTVWLERWGEAVADGLRRAARDLDLLDPDVPAAARDFLEAHPRFTIADHRSERVLTPGASRHELDLLLDAGLARRRPGTRGLRWEAC